MGSWTMLTIEITKATAHTRRSVTALAVLTTYASSTKVKPSQLCTMSGAQCIRDAWLFTTRLSFSAW